MWIELGAGTVLGLGSVPGAPLNWRPEVQRQKLHLRLHVEHDVVVHAASLDIMEALA